MLMNNNVKFTDETLNFCSAGFHLLNQDDRVKSDIKPDPVKFSLCHHFITRQLTWICFSPHRNWHVLSVLLFCQQNLSKNFNLDVIISARHRIIVTYNQKMQVSDKMLTNNKKTLKNNFHCAVDGLVNSLKYRSFFAECTCAVFLCDGCRHTNKNI